jgi:hypothetical protein
VRGVVGRDDEQIFVLDGEKLLAVVVEKIAAGLRGRTRTSTASALHAAPGGSPRASEPAGEDDPSAGRRVQASAVEGAPAGERDAGASPPEARLPAGGGSR